MVAATDVAEMTSLSVPDGHILMIDTPNPCGGTPFDWELFGDITDRYQGLLAGGLNPDNVSAAIRAVQPWGVMSPPELNAQTAAKAPS